MQSGRTMTRIWPKSRLAEFTKILLNICFDQSLLEQGKKEDAERKRLEALAKKKERDELLEAENQSATPKAKAAPAKVTQAQIKAEQAKRMEAMRKAAVAKAEPATHLSAPLEENVNRYDLQVKICPVHLCTFGSRVEIEGESASSVTEAIRVLSVGKEEKVDKHPEKRMKAAYTEFEERRLQELKAENKSLKLSQLKQMVFKEWQKHPDNPLNKQ